MSEETIAFAVIFVPLSISMGYDSLVGIALCYFAAHIGFAGAILNPFTVGIAQGLASVPLFTGIEYRTFCWVIDNFAGIMFLIWYAARIRKNPRKSPMYEADSYWREKGNSHIDEIRYYTPLISLDSRSSYRNCSCNLCSETSGNTSVSRLIKSFCPSSSGLCRTIFFIQALLH